MLHGHDGSDEERLVSDLGHDDDGEGGHECVEKADAHPFNDSLRLQRQLLVN